MNLPRKKMMPLKTDEAQKGRVLIIEDDPSIVAGLRMNLRHEGFSVDTAADGDQGLATSLAWQPDLILLDVMMPNMNGYEVLRELRRRGDTTPVIMLTAKGLEEDKVLGLGLGADDYVQKPFSLPELLARIHAVLRRSSPGQEATICFGEVVVELASRRVFLEDEEVSLSQRERILLFYLIKHPRQVLSREHLLNVAWDLDYEGTERTVDNFIRLLRKKLEADSNAPKHFITVRGMGYRFDP
jgi:two-component system, OmpR family, alkaline phosphatase synthesis response regulator PhoP